MTPLAVLYRGMGFDLMQCGRTVALFAVPHLDGLGMWNGIIMAMATGGGVEDITSGIVVGIGGR